MYNLGHKEVTFLGKDFAPFLDVFIISFRVKLVRRRRDPRNVFVGGGTSSSELTLGVIILLMERMAVTDCCNQSQQAVHVACQRQIISPKRRIIRD